MTQTQLRQSERPAGRRADHLGARPGDPGARADPRISRIRQLLAHLRRSSYGKTRDAQLQHADRPLSRRRRHEDRFHLRVRLQLVASATRNGRRLIAVVLGSVVAQCARKKAAQLLERGFNSGGLSWLTPSLGNVDALAPMDAQPPNLREEMCGGHRRKPPSEENEEEPGEFRCSSERQIGQRDGRSCSLAQSRRGEVRARPAGRDHAASHPYSRDRLIVQIRGRADRERYAEEGKKKVAAKSEGSKKPGQSRRPKREDAEQDS